MHSCVRRAEFPCSVRVNLISLSTWHINCPPAVCHSACCERQPVCVRYRKPAVCLRVSVRVCVQLISHSVPADPVYACVRGPS